MPKDTSKYELYPLCLCYHILISFAHTITCILFCLDLETLLDLPALDNMPNQCPKLLNIYEGVKRHWDIVKDLRYKDGKYVYWNFPRLPWKERNKDSTDVLVADELHYDTIENAGSLKGRQHCATKKRADGETICAKTWNWKKGKCFILFIDIDMR